MASIIDWHNGLGCGNGYGSGSEQQAYPSCDKGMPCCRCGEKDCNSRQVCQKKNTIINP